MKTVVEWLEDNLIFEPWAEEHFKHNSECWDKAKEMEKEQIFKALIRGHNDCGVFTMQSECDEYYNKTFKSE